MKPYMTITVDMPYTTMYEIPTGRDGLTHWLETQGWLTDIPDGYKAYITVSELPGLGVYRFCQEVYPCR